MRADRPVVLLALGAALAITAAESSARGNGKDNQAVPPMPNARGSCTSDGLVKAEMSTEIDRRVTGSIRLSQAGARLRDMARLTLPCGFTAHLGFGGSLLLTNGTEHRQYLENNPFGFSPAFGFGERSGKSYQLGYKASLDGSPKPDGCAAAIARTNASAMPCASFGDPGSFFAVSTRNGRHMISHYRAGSSNLISDFELAESIMPVSDLSFLPPPDAPGGTVTLLLREGDVRYRVFIDVPGG